MKRRHLLQAASAAIAVAAPNRSISAMAAETRIAMLSERPMRPPSRVRDSSLAR